MAKLQILKGKTDVTVYVFIPDSTSTSGAGKTGLVYNSASLVCYYVRPLGSATQLTLATQTVTGAHSDGGFVEVDATNMPGIYRLDLSDAICASGVDSVAVMLKGATGMAPTPLEIQLAAQDIQDATPAVDVTQWLGGTPNALVSGRVDASAGAVASGAITAAAIATDAIDADALAAGAITSDVFAAGAINAAAIDDGAIDRATFAADTGLQTTRSGTAQAGAAGTITLDASASATDDFYNDQIVFITGATGAGQARRISDYTGSSKVANVEPNWATNPDATSTFAILPLARVNVGSWLGSLVNALISGRVDANAQVVGDKTGYSIASGGIAASAFAAGAIDSAAIATGAIDADAIAADAITAAKIANGAIDAATFAAGAIDATAIADNAIDRATFAADTGLQPARSGTAQAGAAGSITLDASASATDALYFEHWVYITGGTGVGQCRQITNYVGSTKVATVVPNWDTTPDNTSTFAIFPRGRISVGLWRGSTPNNLISGRVDSSVQAIANGIIAAATFAAGAIDAAAIAADAIGASELATDAVNEIRDAVWAKAMAELGGVPAVSGTTLEALEWIFLLARNKITQTSTTQTLRNDADSGTIGASTLSDDGTTFTRGEFA